MFTLIFLNESNSMISLMIFSHVGAFCFSTSQLSCFHFFPLLGAGFGVVVLGQVAENASKYFMGVLI